MPKYTMPRGYAETLHCMNQPDSWDVHGMIADMAENLRRDNDVAAGQLLAAIDWMTERLKEAKPIVMAVGTYEARQLNVKLKGFK